MNRSVNGKPSSSYLVTGSSNLPRFTTICPKYRELSSHHVFGKTYTRTRKVKSEVVAYLTANQNALNGVWFEPSAFRNRLYACYTNLDPKLDRNSIRLLI